MFGRFLTALIAAVVLFSFSEAQAAKHKKVGTCRLEASLELLSIHIVWGGSIGNGNGSIICNYKDGSSEELAVDIEVWGAGVGYSINKTLLWMRSHKVKLKGGPSRLLGGYLLARAGIGAGNHGGSGMLDFKATRHSLAIPIRARVDEGAGFELAANLGGIRITPEQPSED